MALARRQHGVISRPELLAFGVSEQTIRTWLANSRLMRLREGVYLVAGSAPSPYTETMAAVRAAPPGAVAAFRSAAFVHDMLERPPPMPEISIPHGTSARLPDAVVRRTRQVDVALARGIPVTSALRTFVDLAGVVDRETLWRAGDEGLVRGRFTPPDLAALDPRGRPGAANLRWLIDGPLLGNESELERRMGAVLHRARRRIPPWVPQLWVVLDGRRHRLDFAWPPQRVGLEVDGNGTRARSRVRTEDIDRQRRFERHGWVLHRATWPDTEEPDELLALLEASLSDPRAGS